MMRKSGLFLLLLLNSFIFSYPYNTSSSSSSSSSSRFLIIENVSSDLVNASVEVITKGFGTNAVTINFISALSDETKVKHYSLIDHLILRCCASEMNTERPLTSVFIEDVNFISQRQRFYNVIFIDSIVSFRKIFAQMMIKNSNFVIDGYYLLVCYVDRGTINELDEDKIHEITKGLWSISIYNVLILIPDVEKEGIKNESRLSLMTFMPFASSRKCDDSTPVTIDIFSNGKFQKKSQFFLSNTRNLSRCPIKVVSFNTPPMMMISYDEKHKFQLNGIDGKMLETLADTLKFSIDLIHFDDNIRWGSISENGSASGAMEMIINKKAHLTLGMYTITLLRSQFMSNSEFYYSVPFVIVVPKGKAFTAFEKLFRPFHFYVWMLLITTFIIAIVVITMIKLKQSNIARIFVLGVDNNSPYLNILISFVGGSLYKLPKNNFARTLLMMFILFSIVKRTLYQAALFQQIQSDVHDKEIQSIDELVEKNFKVYMLASSLEHTENMRFRHLRVVRNASIVQQMLEKTIDPNFKGAVTKSLEQVAYFNKVNRANFTLTVCKEYLFTFQYGIYFQKNSFLTKHFNEKISLFKSSGLIDFWASSFIDSKYINYKSHDKSPKQLKMEQMMGGFELLLIGLILSIFIFVCEILAKLKQIKSLQKFIEFFIEP